MMDYTFELPVLQFHNILETIRKNHPYAEEIAWMDMREEVCELLGQIEMLQGSKLTDYAIMFQNSRLVLIFHAMLQDITALQKDKLIYILSLRMKKRFFYYNWIMLQEHFTNALLMESFIMLIEFMKNKHPAEFDRSFASRMPFPGGDLVHQALSVLESEKCSLNNFLNRYDFMKGSSLYKAILEEYFIQCSKEGFQENPELFMEWIRSSQVRPYPQINHYLDVMSVLEYLEDINEMLIELFGMPGKSLFWDNIEEKFKVKLLEWNKLKDLGKYLGIHTEKFLFWKNYYHYMDKIECYPDLGILFVYLPGHIIIDLKNDSDRSYLYKKGAFKIAYHAFESSGGFLGQSAWPLDRDGIEPVKNAILENRNSEIYELSYERLGKLYIRDYLEMVL